MSPDITKWLLGETVPVKNWLHYILKLGLVTSFKTKDFSIERENKCAGQLVPLAVVAQAKVDLLTHAGPIKHTVLSQKSYLQLGILVKYTLLKLCYHAKWDQGGAFYLFVIPMRVWSKCLRRDSGPTKGNEVSQDLKSKEEYWQQLPKGFPTVGSCRILSLPKIT